MQKTGRNSRCTVLVMGRDASIDLCYITAYFFEKYWKDCPYEVVLCTQTTVPNTDVYDRIIYTDTSLIWGDRLQVALDGISTEYVILLAEDFFLKKMVNTNEIEAVINYCDSEGAGGCRLNPPVPFAEEYNENFLILPNDSIYRICLQPTLFKTEYLRRYAGLHYSPWQFEREGSLKSREFGEKIFCTRSSVYDCIHAWSHGMWDREAYQLMKNSEIPMKLYEGKKIYPWYRILWDKLCIAIISMAPTLLTKIRIRQCKHNEKKLRG